MSMNIKERWKCPSCGNISRQFGIYYCPKCNVRYVKDDLPQTPSHAAHANPPSSPGVFKEKEALVRASAPVECVYSTPDEFEIADGVLIHYNGKATHIRVPEGVHTIGENAFVNVTERTVEQSIPPMFWDQYGADSFTGMAKVTSKTYDGIASIRHVTLPEGVICIRKHAFYRCRKLEEVVLPSSLRTITYRAFCECGRLSRINFPENVVLEWNAFEGCSADMRKAAEDFRKNSGKPLQASGYRINIVQYGADDSSDPT